MNVYHNTLGWYFLRIGLLYQNQDETLRNEKNYDLTKSYANENELTGLYTI